MQVYLNTRRQLLEGLMFFKKDGEESSRWHIRGHLIKDDRNILSDLKNLNISSSILRTSILDITPAILHFFDITVGVGRLVRHPQEFVRVIEDISFRKQPNPSEKNDSRGGRGYFAYSPETSLSSVPRYLQG